MTSKQRIMSMLLVSITALSAIEARHSNKASRKQKPCNTKVACETNKNCQCYCSEKGDFREKNNSDKPVYVENDPNGKYCYCKPWDLDNYPGPVARQDGQMQEAPAAEKRTKKYNKKKLKKSAPLTQEVVETDIMFVEEQPGLEKAPQAEKTQTDKQWFGWLKRKSAQ